MRVVIRAGLVAVLVGAGGYILWRNRKVRRLIERYLGRSRQRMRSGALPVALRENTHRLIETARQRVQEAPLPLHPRVEPQRVDHVSELDLMGEGLLIRERIMSALGHEHQLEGAPKLNINVERAGVVFLRGVVHDATQRDRAAQVARAVEGVTEVVNLIELAPAV